MRHLLLLSLVLAVGCAHHRQNNNEFANNGQYGNNTYAASGQANNWAAGDCSNVFLRFPDNSATLTQKDKARLDRVATCLNSNQPVQVLLGGRMSGDGGQDQVSVASQRADAVTTYLKGGGFGQQQLGNLFFDTVTPLSQQVAQAGGPSCADDSACDGQSLCINGRCSQIAKGQNECSAARVRFDRGSAQLTADAQRTIDRLARCLKANQSTHLVIEGTADESRSMEKNLELGDRRASAVANQLEQAGVSPGQLDVMSFAEETILCPGGNQKCTVTRGFGGRNSRTAGRNGNQHM